MEEERKGGSRGVEMEGVGGRAAAAAVVGE